MLKSILVGALALCSASLLAQPNVGDFEEFLDQCVASYELPSLAVAVVKDGEVVLSYHRGQTLGLNSTPVTDQSLYAIASLSKAFTATAVAILADEGKLQWTDRVVDHLPWFKLHDTVATKQFTVADLLCHRSGLETFDGDLLWYGTQYTPRQALDRIRHIEPSYPFRTQFGYQNLMFMAAGELVAKCSGTPWNVFVTERILKPLEMNNTTAVFEQFFNKPNAVRPTLNGQVIPMLSYNNSAATAALNSCTADMAKWIVFWTNRGKALISEASFQKVTELHTALPQSEFDKTHGVGTKGYGLGWFVMDFKNEKVIHHGGGLPGYISKLAVAPSSQFGVIVLTNSMTNAPSMLAYAALEWANERPYSQLLTEFETMHDKGIAEHKKALAERAASQKPNLVLDDILKYTGTYVDSSYGEAKIFIEQNQLHLTLLPTKELFSGKLTAWDEGVLRFDHNDPFLTYGLIKTEETQGVVTGFTIDLPNDDFHFQKLHFARVR